jgi:plasmid stabilization system protein ParE
VPKKRLEFALRARRDIEAIETWYLETAGEKTANHAVDAILDQAEKIAMLGLIFRPGIHMGTRECVMQRFPYTLVYTASGGAIKIVRVLHQRSAYFNQHSTFRGRGKGGATARLLAERHTDNQVE